MGHKSWREKRALKETLQAQSARKTTSEVLLCKQPPPDAKTIWRLWQDMLQRHRESSTFAFAIAL